VHASAAQAAPFRAVAAKPEIWKRFTLSVSLAVSVIVLAIFTVLFLRNRDALRDEVTTRARAHIHDVQLMREWNAMYGSVYVEKGPGVESNPYLEHPDLTTSDGRVFTLKNPSLMTREISGLADKHGMFTFHITSLNPLNPANVPDAFEREALKSFESGATEVSITQAGQDGTYFRFMAPLYVESDCLPCHAKQGYKAGEVRGGISVRFDISGVHRAQTESGTAIILVCVGTLVLLLGTLYVFIFKLMGRLRTAQQELESMALTDPLTGLYNRAFLFERLREEAARAARYKIPVGTVMLDVDHFKAVNDTFGHQAGDHVLAGLAGLMREHIRETDLAVRFGGEEFLLLLPGIGMEGACAVAEKIRAALEGTEFSTREGAALRVTASFGCAALEPQGGTPWEGASAVAEDLLRRADKALYAAKSAGRNCVRSEGSASPSTPEGHEPDQKEPLL